MKRRLLVSVAMLILAGALHGADRPYLEFVEALRARGYPDLALEYLQQLGPKAPPALAKVLPLEMAKARTDMAQLDTDPARRDKLFTDAREELLAFLKKNAQAPVAAEAHLELGRVYSLQGKLLLNRAERQEQPEAKQPALDKARPLFEEAGKNLQAAITALDAQLARKDLPDQQKQSLTRTKLQTSLDQGINSLYEFLTLDDQAADKRLAAAKKALALLQQTAGGDDKNPLTWVAHAWVGRYYYETQDFGKAKRELLKVTDEKSPAADAGKRLARYFQLLVLEKEPDPKKPDAKRKGAQEWLRDYPAYRNTPEGFGVRFLLAEDYLEQARKIPNSPTGRQLLEDAEKIYAELERTENDFTRQASERKLWIVYARSAERTKGDISKLRDFQECYLRAQAEIAQLHEQERKPPKDVKEEVLKKQKQEHLTNMVAALNRALELADDQTPANDLTEARYLLTYIYLKKVDDPYRAAILGEALARSDPKSNRAAAAAAFALEAYYQVLAKDEGEDGSAREVEADRKRLRGLALYMEKTWPAEEATDEARFLLGTLAFRDKDYPEVLRTLGKINPNTAGYTLSQFKLGAAALELQKDGKKPRAGQPSYQEQAIAAFRKVPPLAAGADPLTTQYYLYSKVELAKLLFATKKFDELAQLTATLAKTFDSVKAKLNNAIKAEVEPVLNVLPVYAMYGKATLEYQATHYAEVLKVLEPTLTQLKENKLPDLNDPKVVRGIQGLALRANVQEGHTKEAKEILDNLLSKKTEGDLEGTTAILGELVLQLKTQVEELRKRGPSAQKELDETVKRFSAFLNELAKEPADKLTPELVRFLAFSYAGLQQHGKAADFLARIPAPKAEPGKKLEPEQEAFYQGIQLMTARELRLAKQFDKAHAKLKGILLSDWGKKTLEVKKELNWLWEDEQHYGAAAKGWNELLGTLRQIQDQNAKFRDMYYECYYHVVYCLYKHGLTLKDPAKKRESTLKAANWYVRLKKNKPDMGGEGLKTLYDELLQKEPALKKACDELEKMPD